ncbi:hypothetical protein [Selenomonas noxia]|jgi:hypothetical protein|uniref:MuF-C-terminal domain-containing protein n=1 Tax=Selenomonas noxia TaxID=135083 RepID=UPI00288A822B|nr:hypothetical protein [Selenomonas noxia]
MAFDLEGYLSDANARQEKRQAQEQERAAAEAEAAKPLYEKAWDAAGEAWDAVKDTANDVVTTAITSGTRFANAYGKFLDERMASNEPRHEFMNRPDVQETVDELGSSAADFVLSPVRIVADRTTRPLRSYIGSQIEQSADEGSEIAQDLRSTETFVSYFMTPEDKLRKAREIEENTGISADSFMDDDIAYKQALKINDYTQKKRELMQDNFSMEAVWQEFPEIRDIAKMSPRDAALALHDIESVRQTHGIVETFTHFLELGNKRLEFNNLMYKVFLGTADDNDLQRAADLDKMIEKDEKEMPSFWDDPLAAIAGGMASSGPEMLQSVREGIRDGLIMAEATAATSAAAGTAIEPGGGTLIGGVGGAGVGFAVGTIRSMSARTGIITAARATFANASRNQLIRAAAGAGMREGMFEGMRRPETGERYAEYRAMKDVDGNPLNTDDQARAYALVGGAINPAIEMMNFGLVTKPLRGLNLLGKEGAEGYAEKAIRGIVDQAKYDIGKSESVVAFAKNHIKDALKIAGTESAEESAQSLSDDLIHNSIVASSDGRAADKAYSIGDMAVNAIVSGAEAFPVGLGFGMASSVGAVPGVVRHAQRLSSEKTREDIAAQRTMTGTIMLDRLQQVASSAKLKQTAPDVQQKIIRAQASGTGFENAYIDTETALQKENGLADLKEVAKAAGIRDEELENTIKNGGHLFVPIEKYAQSAASPQLLESVSFSPETDSLARMKKNAKDLSDEVEQAQKNAIKAKTDIIHAITNEWFPEAPDHASDKEKLRRSSEREMAIAAITQDQDSPASGWRKLYNEFVADRDELLRPAMDALQRGMGNGVDIIQNGEDGRGIRVSNNEPWYQDFYKENGRAPRKGELMDLAYRLTVGDASAPKIEGWAPASQEDIDAMEGAKGQLDELNDYIQTLENIKDRMMQVDAAEIKGTAGLSPEAYSVYRQIMAQLKAIGGQQSRAARMNALLFAHHADQFARVMREKEGKQNYTAMDYMQERFGLRSGGKYTEEGTHQTAGQSAEARLARDESNWNALIDRYDAADKKKWKAKKDGKLFRVMDVPLVMQLINIPYDSLHVFGSFFAHSVNPKHKGMTLDILRQLPRKMADPLMIIRGNDAGSYVFVVELKDTNGATVVAPVEIGKDIKSTGGIVNVINSAFGKTAGKKGDKPSLKWFDKQFKANNVLYINKNKSIAWLQPYRNGSPAVAAISNALSKFIVSGVGQNVKTEVDLEAAKKENPGFYQMFWTESEKFNHRVVDIQFIEVDEKQALKSPNIGIRHDDNVYQLGDELENSHDWPEGNWTETELDGACAIDVADSCSYDSLDELKETAIRRLNDSNEYLNENVYLISGTSHEYGNDPNEVILRNPEVIGILKLVRWDELSEEEQEQYRKRQEEMSDEEAAEVDEVDEEHNKGFKFTYDGKDAGELSGDILEALEILDRQPKAHDTESLREKYRERLVSGERTVEFDKKQLANVNKALSILEKNPNATKEDFAKEFHPDSNIMMTIKYPSSEGLAADLAYEKEGILKSIEMDQHRVDVLRKIDPDKLEWKERDAETFRQQLQREVYGEILQENGKRIITLFEGANESTMLHEMGHMFLMDLDDLAEMDETSAKDQATVNEWAEWKPGAAEEYRDTDWKDEFWKYERDIIAAEKSGDAVAIKSAKERWRQERFARGFEIYLHDGKAPSKALRGVFRKFKQFLRKLYKFVENVGGKPSAEVEAVMSRMIASEEEIKAAELDERYRPIERLGGKETLENLLGKSIAETYQKWLKESRDDAEDRLRAEVMKDLKKEAREEYNEKVEAERTRKREELESDPVYLAEMALKNGGKEAAAIIGNWFPSMEAYKEARAKRKSLETELTEYMTEYARGLDKEILQARLTDENIAKAMQTPKAYHRRVALEAAGMRAKERLMRRLDDRIQDAVKGALDALNDVPEDTDLRKEQDSEAMKKIMAAVQNLRSSGKWTPEEYKRLEDMASASSKKEIQKKLQAFWDQNYKKVRESLRKENKKTWRRKNFDQQVWENDKFIREQARMVLADLPISESCNPAYFRRKERQHARAVDKALSQERWDIAYAEKEQQALAAACAYEATKNEEKLNQMKADVQRKLGARTVRLAAAERYWLHHIAYLLGLKGSDVEKPEGYVELGALFESYKNNLDMDADAPTEILEMLSKENSSYRKMKLGEFSQAVNMLKALYTIGRDKNRMLSVGGKDFDDIVREILASTTSLTPEGVVQHPVSPDTGGLGYSDWLAKVPGIGEQLAILGQKGAMPLIKPEILIRLLGEEAHRYLYGTYERAQMREAELLGQSQKELERILSAYSKKERMEWKDRNIDVGGDKLSKENILCLALNWGSETNRKRVIDGIGQRLDVQGVFAKHMTERDWKAVQQIWDFVDTFWKETAEVEEKLNGSHLGKVPASAFRVETSDGKEITLRGGYYPLKYNPEKSTQAKEKEVEDQAQKTLAGARVLGTGRSHVKERSENDVKEPLLLEFRVLQEHVYNAAHNIAFRVAARDVHRIVRNAEFKAYVTSTYGMPFWNSLDQWVLDTWAIAADGSSDRAATAISRTMAALRRNSTMAIMGWRLWPVVENASNIGPMMDKLGAVEANAAIADYYANKKEMDDLLHKSIFMSDRINNMERDLRHDKRLFDPTYTPVEFLRDNAYWALAQTDLMLSKPLWCRAYKNAFPEMLAEINRENEENKRAYQEAQENVERLRAETYDMRKELYYLRDEAEERRYMNPERMRESKYAALSDQELIEEQQRWETKIKDREKEFYEAGHRLERASELPIREGREIIEEAELRAVQKADAAVRDVFGSGQTKDLAEVQRSRNEAVKMLTSFYSFFNTQFNAILEAHFKGKYDAHGYKYMHVWMPLARAVIYRIVLVTLIGAGLKFALGLEGDDEKDRYRTVKDPKTGETKKEEVSDYERFMSVFGKNLLSTGTGTLPIVRDVAGLIGSAVFDGTTYGRNFELGSVLTRGAKQVQATVNLMIQKGKKDLEREEKEAKERERVKKMTPKQRKAYEEAKKYKKPEKEIGYLDIAKSAAQATSTFTAASTGVTNTITDGIFSALQYAADMMETDNYYDKDFRNVMRSVLFDKKLRAEEPLPKPEKPKKPKKNTRGAR